MIKCLECNQQFKSITNTHLLNCCGLTIKEYCIKHNIQIENIISNNIGNYKHASPELMKNSVEKTKKTKLRKETILKLTDEEFQIIYGSLLGDGYLHCGSKILDSTYLILEHGINQVNYLLWKGVRLERLQAKFYQYYRFNPVKNRFCTFNQVRTRSIPILGELGALVYKEDGSGKYIHEELLKRLEPQGLAVFFMDDGTRYHAGGAIATQSFSYKDNEILCDYFSTKYDIKPHILKDEKDAPYLAFKKIEFNKLCEVLQPHMFYSMLYKVQNENKLSRATIGRRVTFDSAHFLDEYDGKCSNLHGGRYTLWIYVTDYINPETGMVIDYGYLKTILDKYIVKEFDHHCINYKVGSLQWRSTTELMSMYIWKVLIEFIPNLSKIELFETDGSKCEFIGPTLDDMKKNKNLEFLNTFKEEDKKWRERIIIEFKTLFNNVDQDHYKNNDISEDFKKHIQEMNKILIPPKKSLEEKLQILKKLTKSFSK